MLFNHDTIFYWYNLILLKSSVHLCINKAGRLRDQVPSINPFDLIEFETSYGVLFIMGHVSINFYEIFFSWIVDDKMLLNVGNLPICWFQDSTHTTHTHTLKTILQIEPSLIFMLILMKRVRLSIINFDYQICLCITLPAKLLIIFLLLIISNFSMIRILKKVEALILTVQILIIFIADWWKINSIQQININVILLAVKFLRHLT